MSERVVRKMYLDFEKEERWLNHMAAEGWELVRHTWCRYVFEKGVPGRYVYRIQLLPDPASAPESHEYLGFLEEAGVEVVDTYQRWVYVRKSADGQPFELFSDGQSRLAHHKRVAGVFAAIAAAQLPLMAANATNVATSIRERAYFPLPLFVVHVALVAVLVAVALRQLAAVRRLEQEAVVHE